MDAQKPSQSRHRYAIRNEPGGSEEPGTENWADSRIEAKIHERFNFLKENILKKVFNNKPPDGGYSGDDGEQEVLHGTFTMFRLLSNRVNFIQGLNRSKKEGGTPDGFGRTDAFARLRIVLLGKKHAYPHCAPVDYPHLWGMGEAQWLHWDGNTNAAMERNVGQALGLGASFSDSSYDSSVLVRNLHVLEMLARKIQPPGWPEEVLGRLDREKVSRGEVLFARHCFECHQPSTAPAPKRFAYRLFDPQETGTDPNRIDAFRRSVNGRAFSEVLAELLGKVRRRAYESERPGIDAATEFEWNDRIERPAWRTTGRYVARPLVGVWATAPYLHNGSVPSLHDLLLPANRRPVTFPSGHREFDVRKVGYVQAVENPPDVFDTRLPGNSNAGHEHGEKMSAPEREDLLEFLKSL
jgi:hypothetical protein